MLLKYMNFDKYCFPNYPHAQLINKKKHKSVIVESNSCVNAEESYKCLQFKCHSCNCCILRSSFCDFCSV